jgi:hypothetical protein
MLFNLLFLHLELKIPAQRSYYIIKLHWPEMTVREYEALAGEFLSGLEARNWLESVLG